MKVVFISPYYHNIWESVGIGYIVSYLKKHLDVEVKFFHENFDDIEDILGATTYADVVAFSCTTPTRDRGLTIADQVVKNRENKLQKIVFGGWHVTTMYESGRLTIPTWIDALIVGEGEWAFLNYIENMPDCFDVQFGIKLPFNQLSWPDRDVINQKRQIDYCEREFGERIVSVQSVRGCRMSCAMCGERCMSGKYNKVTNPLRIRDPKDTLDEVEYLDRTYNISRFKFLDPTWSATEKYVVSFCEEKLRRGNTIKWDGMVHAALATENSLKIMAQANCDVMMVGCESGDQGLLNDMRKGLTIGKIKRVFEWGRKYGINRRAFFVLGMPNENSTSIQNTIKLVEEIDPDIFGLTILAPYPGTDFYDHNKFKDIDWSKVDEYSNDIWSTKNYSNGELKEIQREITMKFKSKLPWNQRYMLGAL